MKMSSDSVKKEPLIRIAKRTGLPLWKSWGIHIAAFLLSMVVYVLVVRFFTGLTVGEVFKYILKGAFGTTQSRIFSEITLWTTIRNTFLLFGVALALAPAFRMRFWNIGGEGQILIGGLVSAILMLFLSEKVSNTLLIFLMLVASIVAGAIWAVIPAIFKASRNTNETLFTLMMNYIAIQLVAYCNIIWEKKKGSGTISVINPDTHAGWMPQGVLSNIFGEDSYIILTASVLIIAVFVYFYMAKTKHGYELTVVGESHNTARYSGINVAKVIIRTVAVSGAICGIMGFLLVSDCSHTITVGTAENRGFTAIIVAWLGKLNTFYMFLVSAMLIILGKGANELASKASLNVALADVLTGIVLFFILASEFFTNYKLIFRRSENKSEVVAETESK